MTDEIKSTRTEEISQALKVAYKNAGNLKLSKAEKTALMKPFDEKDIEILADGSLYIPHIFLSQRLNQIFGPGAWIWICRDHWFDDATVNICAEYVLVLRQCVVGEFYGELPFNSKKEKYQHVLASISAKGLRSVCGKNLSCGSQLWQPSFCAAWQKKFGEQYDGEVYNEEFGSMVSGKVWRKKGSDKTVIGADQLPASKKEKSKPTENDRFIMIQCLSTVGVNHAIAYAISEGILKEGQTLEDWPLDKVARSQDEMKDLQGRIVTFATPTKEEKKWWNCLIPYGSNMGKPLGNLKEKYIRELSETVDAKWMKAHHPEFNAALIAAKRDDFKKPKPKSGPR